MGWLREAWDGLGCWFSSLANGGKVHKSDPGPCPTMVLQPLIFLNMPNMSQSLKYKDHEEKDFFFFLFAAIF